MFIAKNVKIAVEAITTYLSQKEFEIIGTTPNAKVAIDQIKKLLFTLPFSKGIFVVLINHKKILPYCYIRQEGGISG